MSLNPVSVNHAWNYSRPDDEGYALSVTGTVVFLQEIQASKYNPNRKPGQRPVPDFWDDGNPKMNIRMGLALPDGQLRTLVFQPAGKAQKAREKPSIHMDLFDIAGGRNILDLIGKTITIETWPANPQTGQAWGNGNPRLWRVAEAVGYGPYQLAMPLDPEYQLEQVLLDDGAHGGQAAAPAPQQIQVPQPQYQAQPAMPTPTMQPTGVYPAPAPAPQPVPVQQPMGTVQAMQPAAPAGMDPAVAAAMQQVGAVNVQPMAPVVVQPPADMPQETMPF